MYVVHLYLIVTKLDNTFVDVFLHGGKRIMTPKMKLQHDRHPKVDKITMNFRRIKYKFEWVW